MQRKIEIWQKNDCAIFQSEQHLNHATSISKMSWEHLENIAKNASGIEPLDKGHCKVITPLFSTGAYIETIKFRRNELTIANIFNGIEPAPASWENTEEYLFKLCLLPKPHIPAECATPRNKNFIEFYDGGDGADLCFACNEYIIVKCRKIIARGDLVTVKGIKFPYTLEKFRQITRR